MCALNTVVVNFATHGSYTNVYLHTRLNGNCMPSSLGWDHVQPKCYGYTYDIHRFFLGEGKGGNSPPPLGRSWLTFYMQTFSIYVTGFEKTLRMGSARYSRNARF